jgi:hypothetical protein
MGDRQKKQSLSLIFDSEDQQCGSLTIFWESRVTFTVLSPQVMPLRREVCQDPPTGPFCQVFSATRKFTSNRCHSSQDNKTKCTVEEERYVRGKCILASKKTDC